jgi:hypothetical protein
MGYSKIKSTLITSIILTCHHELSHQLIQSEEGLKIRLVPWHATLMGDIPPVLLIVVLKHYIHADCAKVASIKVTKKP